MSNSSHYCAMSPSINKPNIYECQTDETYFEKYWYYPFIASQTAFRIVCGQFKNKTNLSLARASLLGLSLAIMDTVISVNNGL